MDYSIKEIVNMINGGEMYLPAIQRKFVWKTKQIKSFFDSLMKGYPIGMFLFWRLNYEMLGNYNTFYQFIRDYDESNQEFNGGAPNPLIRNFIAVLDGQQRLSSLYIALQGTYTTKTVGGNRSQRKLYLNLLNFPRNELEKDYEFKFLTDQESRENDNDHFWFRVSDILEWNNSGEVNRYAQQLSENNRTIKKHVGEVAQILGNLFSLINEKRIISYEVNNQNIDEILEIFTRTNSGGTKLSRADLLFSIVVANWNGARNKIEFLLDDINNGGEFNFDTDFIIRSSLFLSDLPVRLSGNTLTEENVRTIRENWNGIATSIKKTVELLKEFNFNGKILTSKMAVIPISYYFLKKINPDNQHNQLLIRDNKEKIKNYLIRALLKKIYGGHSDELLKKIRDVLVQSFGQSDDFPLQNLINADLGRDKSLRFDEQDIDEVLQYRYNKQSSYTFMVLSLLYPNLRFGEVIFHQDHIHPRKFFTGRYSLSVDNETLQDWKIKKDMVPNLQFLEGKTNQEKNDTPFSQWIDNNFLTPEEKQEFFEENYIPNMDLRIENFGRFFEERRELLKRKLEDILSSNSSNVLVSSGNTNISKQKSSVDNPKSNENYENGSNRKTKSTNKRRRFYFKEKQYAAKTWMDLLIKICELVLQEHQNEKHKFFEIKGTKNKYFSERKDDLKNPKKISDSLYVETRGFSPNLIKRVIEKVLGKFNCELNLCVKITINVTRYITDNITAQNSALSQAL